MSKQDEIILKSSGKAGWLVELLRERILDINGEVKRFPFKGEIPKCSEILVSKWRVV